MRLKISKILIILLLVCSGMLGLLASMYLHSTEHPELTEINAQLIQTFHSPTTFVTQLQGDPDAGRKIFQEFCSACHSQNPVIDVKAPRIGDKQAWGVRRKLGISSLLQTTIQGRGAMPARGGCFECNDDQLRKTIQYILHHS